MQSIENIVFAVPVWLALFFWLAACFRLTFKSKNLVAVFAVFMSGVLLFLVLASLSWLVCLTVGLPVSFSTWPATLLSGVALRSLRSMFQPWLSATWSASSMAQGSMLLVLILLINVSTIWFALSCMQGGEPTYFISVDQPFFYSHAQALIQYGHAADLSFAGNYVHYHYGYALMVAILSKAFGFSPGTSFFVIGAALIRLSILAVLLLNFFLFTTDLKNRLYSCFLSMAVILLFANFNSDNFLLMVFTKHISQPWHQFAEPIFFMVKPFEGNTELYVALILIVFAMTQRGSVWVGVPLGFLSFVKPNEGFLPVALAYTVIAGWYFVRYAKIRPIIGGILGLVLAMSLSPFRLMVGEGLAPNLGLNPATIERATYIGPGLRALWSLMGAQIGQPTPGLAHTSAVILKWLPWIVLLLVTFVASRSAAQRVHGDSNRLCGLSFPLLTLLFSLALPFLFVLHVHPVIEYFYSHVSERTFFLVINENLINIHRTFGFIVVFICGLIIGRNLRNASWPARIPAYLLFGFGLTVATFNVLAPPNKCKEFVYTPPIREVLRFADAGKLILTNQLHLQFHDEQRDYNNFLFPSLYGHSFYGNAFQYLNFQCQSDIDRMLEVQAFWKNPWNRERSDFLRSKDISYLFVDLSAEHTLPENLDQFNMQLVAANSQFKLIEVLHEQ